MILEVIKGLDDNARLSGELCNGVCEGGVGISHKCLSDVFDLPFYLTYLVFEATEAAVQPTRKSVVQLQDNWNCHLLLRWIGGLGEFFRHYSNANRFATEMAGSALESWSGWPRGECTQPWLKNDLATANCFRLC